MPVTLATEGKEAGGAGVAAEVASTKRFPPLTVAPLIVTLAAEVVAPAWTLLAFRVMAPAGLPVLVVLTVMPELRVMLWLSISKVAPGIIRFPMEQTTESPVAVSTMVRDTVGTAKETLSIEPVRLATLMFPAMEGSGPTSRVSLAALPVTVTVVGLATTMGAMPA